MTRCASRVSNKRVNYKVSHTRVWQETQLWKIEIDREGDLRQGGGGVGESR